MLLHPKATKRHWAHQFVQPLVELEIRVVRVVALLLPPTERVVLPAAYAQIMVIIQRIHPLCLIAQQAL